MSNTHSVFGRTEDDQPTYVHVQVGIRNIWGEEKGPLSFPDYGILMAETPGTYVNKRLPLFEVRLARRRRQVDRRVLRRARKHLRSHECPACDAYYANHPLRP